MDKKTRSQTVNRHIKSKYDRISFIVPKGTKEKLKDYAEKNKTSTNKLLGEYVITLVSTKPEVPESFTKALDSLTTKKLGRKKKAD